MRRDRSDSVGRYTETKLRNKRGNRLRDTEKVKTHRERVTKEKRDREAHTQRRNSEKKRKEERGSVALLTLVP